MWLARDKDNKLILSTNKPLLFKKEWTTSSLVSSKALYNFMHLDSNIFPEVTFENSPVEAVILTKTHLEELLNIERHRGYVEGQIGE